MSGLIGEGLIGEGLIGEGLIGEGCLHDEGTRPGQGQGRWLGGLQGWKPSH